MDAILNVIITQTDNRKRVRKTAKLNKRLGDNATPGIVIDFGLNWVQAADRMEICVWFGIFVL